MLTIFYLPERWGEGGGSTHLHDTKYGLAGLKPAFYKLRGRVLTGTKSRNQRVMIWGLRGSAAACEV